MPKEKKFTVNQGVAPAGEEFISHKLHPPRDSRVKDIDHKRKMIGTEKEISKFDLQALEDIEEEMQGLYKQLIPHPASDLDPDRPNAASWGHRPFVEDADPEYYNATSRYHNRDLSTAGGRLGQRRGYAGIPPGPGKPGVAPDDTQPFKIKTGRDTGADGAEFDPLKQVQKIVYSYLLDF